MAEKEFLAKSYTEETIQEHTDKVLQEYEKRLQRTIKHKELNRDVSYRYLFRLECYKLIKHLTEEKEYEGFKIWW